MSHAATASSHPFLLVSCPLLWAFGSLYLSINSLHFYARDPTCPNRSYLLVQAVVLNLCAVLTLANILHMALQLPTSQMALHFQRHAQAGMWLLFTAVLLANVCTFDSQSVQMGRFMIQCGGVYLILTIGTGVYYTLRA